jgi:hypothetical protein
MGRVMADTNFNVESLRIKELPPLDPAVAKPRRRREFVMVSRWQFDRLCKAKHFAAERVFLHLLFLTWRSPRKSVRLANAGLKQKGVSRYIKRRVLRELEALGLIGADWQSRKSPTVTVLDGITP